MTNPNDVVHPICHWQGDVHSGHTLGLTKREYFAAMAMQAYLSRTDLTDFVIAEKAANACAAADALIKELNK